MSNFRRFVPGTLIFVLLAAIVGAQDISDRHVFVTVLDKDGIPIEGLTTEHFAIMESGRERKVLRAEPLQVPMHVAVLVDTSAAGAPNEIFKSAVVEFVDRLAALNTVAIYSTGYRATLVVPYTRDARQLRAGLDGMFNALYTRSAVVDGIDRALQDLAKLEVPRPVIVSISSEAAEASGKSAGSVIRRMIAQSTAFHAVAIATSTGTGGATKAGAMTPAGVAASSAALTSMIAAGEGDRERTQLLEQGTKSTGGGRQRITSTMALKAALHRVGNELATSYRVTFERPGNDRVKDLQVGLYLEGVSVRATPAPFGTR
jgi:VWFA-related protein